MGTPVSPPIAPAPGRRGSSTRIAELDALRALAAIAVVAYHYSRETPWFDRGLYAGLMGLDLFFVLSGFLISSIILANGGGPGFLRSFYVRRGLRIWPAYYLLIAGVALTVAIVPDVGTLHGLPYYLTFTQNLPYYWSDHVPSLARPAELTWSLAVEEQFYLVWPLLLGLVGARRMRPLALALVTAAIAARRAGFHSWILIAHCDAFAIGSLLALVMRESTGAGPSSRQLSRRLTVAATACLFYLLVGLPLMGGRPFDEESGPWALNLTVVAGFFACVIGLLVLHAGHPVLAPLRARWLARLGTISYGIYLYHIAVLLACAWMLDRVGLPTIAAPAIAGPLTVAVATASWAWIESPVLRLKDWFAYGRTAAVASRPPESPSAEAGLLAAPS
jgi:peptidoglycan/LPS O-acetylase OafA/YrhL